MNKVRTVAVSGYFNPLHKGHIALFREARALGDRLVVIVNNDKQVALKGAHPFMSAIERAEIVSALRDVDEAIIAVDNDQTVCKTIEMIKPHIFANGGDRRSALDIPEAEICRRLGICMIFEIGGKKTQSSSWLLSKVGARVIQKVNEK
jgi:cytidyltransferase-like protein